jgi:hypothetical protein
MSAVAPSGRLGFWRLAGLVVTAGLVLGAEAGAQRGAVGARGGGGLQAGRASAGSVRSARALPPSRAVSPRTSGSRAATRASPSPRTPLADRARARERAEAFSGGHYGSVRSSGRHVVRKPPPRGPGTVVPDLKAAIKIHHARRSYWFERGRYYCRRLHAGVIEYEEVDAPIGLTVCDVPEDIDFEEVEVEGKTRHVFDGVVYEKIRRTGKDCYKVVGYLET